MEETRALGKPLAGDAFGDVGHHHRDGGLPGREKLLLQLTPGGIDVRALL